MSQSLNEPQLEPSDHAYTILADYGPDGGGWGPAALAVLGEGSTPTPFIYTGESTQAILHIYSLAHRLHERTGLPVRVARFTNRVDELVLE